MSKFASLNKSLAKGYGVSDMKEVTGDNRVAYSTGIPDIDADTRKTILFNGQNYTSEGFLTGGFFLFSGPSQTGKSTIALQVAANIVRGDEFKNSDPNYKNGWIELYSTEDGIEKDRISQITGFPLETLDEKVRITSNQFTGTENFEMLIKNISNFKKENQDIFTYTTTTPLGEIKKEYVPTVLVVDSYTMLFPKDLSSLENDAKNTFYAHQNNKNAMMIQRVIPHCRATNIMIIAITHSGSKMTIGGLPPKRKYKALAADVNISGGEKLMYAMDYGIYFNKYSSKSNIEEHLKEEYQNGTLHYAVESICFKNRRGKDGSIFTLVSTDIGFSPLYSAMFNALTRGDFIKGAAHKTMDGYDKKFYKKEIVNLLQTDKEFSDAFFKHYYQMYKMTTEEEELENDMQQKEDAINDAMGF